MISTGRQWLHRVASGPSGLMSQRRSSADSGPSRDRYRTAGVDPLQTSMASPADSRADQERSFASDFGHGGGPAHVNSSSSAFASLRSGVSKPSVNHS
jgi:hypothetical protein